VSSNAIAAAPAGLEFFEQRIRPMLAEHCIECHGPEKQKGGLRVDSRTSLLHGGENGPAMVPGKPEASLLLKAISHSDRELAMPSKKPRLPQPVIEDITRWIREGAPWPASDPTPSPTKAGFDLGARKQRLPWIWQTPRRQPIPTVPGTQAGTDIDQFIRARLANAGLQPALPTDDATWLRRAHFTITGLPPTRAELQAFLSNTAPDRRAQAVDQLLASPHYGERWARHWLDVARYADSNGMDENIAFGHAWRYRDYVVRAFNNDKPYNDFLIEQIAGDLLPRSEDAVTATGFLSLGARVLAEPDIQKLELDIIDEQIDTLGKAFLGMTLGCVRCHDHKFDPILQDDYYALAAIFRSTKSLSDERMGAIKFWYEHSLATPAQTEAKRKAEEQVKAKRAEVTAFTTKARNEIKAELQSRAADYLAAAATLPMEADYAMVEALAKEHGLRPRYLLTCRQALARQVEHPFFAAWRGAQGNASAVRQHYAPLFAEALISKKGAAYEALTDLAGFLAVPDKDADAFDAATLAKIEGMNQVLKSLEAQAPELPAIMGVAEGTVTRTLPIHIRGSYLTLGKPVERGFPEVMRTSLTKPVLPTKESGRLELARWMASTEHPLTARVAVSSRTSPKTISVLATPLARRISALSRATSSAMVSTSKTSCESPFRMTKKYRTASRPTSSIRSRTVT
jgi:mono/diheme cytochrome c family protein